MTKLAGCCLAFCGNAARGNLFVWLGYELLSKKAKNLMSPLSRSADRSLKQEANGKIPKTTAFSHHVD